MGKMSHTTDGLKQIRTIQHHLLHQALWLHLNHTGGHIVATHKHTNIHACMAAAPVTSSNNGGHCHFIVSTNTNKTVDSADGAKKKRQIKGLMSERKPFCWDWWRVQMENMAPLLTAVHWSVCVCVFIVAHPPYVRQCVCTFCVFVESNRRIFIVVLKQSHCVIFFFLLLQGLFITYSVCVCVVGDSIMDTPEDEAPTLPLRSHHWCCLSCLRPALRWGTDSSNDACHNPLSS